MLDYVTLAASFVAKALAGVFLPLQSNFSIASLFSALCIAISFIFLSRRAGRRNVSYRVMLRALFPSWLYRSASFRADVMFFFFNVLAFGALFGWAIVSSDIVTDWVTRHLTTSFGRPGGGFSGFGGIAAAAVATFIAYELAFWLDHYLSHRIPLLWDFHKVHHTADVLSPLTNFRVHPVDGVVFGNILGLFIGMTNGVLTYLNIGPTPNAGVSILAVAAMWILGHLHHSHLWIAITGPLGHVILSPAHHQIHHSDNPRHFNKNFGAFLSLWDWLFGTLHMPERNREPLRFGVGSQGPAEHTFVAGMLTPFVVAERRLRRRTRRLVRIRRASTAS